MAIDVGYQVLADRLIDWARSAGATDAEVFMQWGEKTNIQANRGRLENQTRAGSKGVGLRILVDGRLAFLSSTDFDEPSLKRLVEDTVSLAGLASPEPFNDFPEPGSTEGVGGLFDPDLVEMPIERKIELVKALDDLVFENHREIRNTEGAAYSDAAYENLIVNSKGMAHRWKESFVTLVVSPVAEREGQKQVAHYWSSAREFRDLLSPAEIASEACRRARLLLGGEAVSSRKVPVVLDSRTGAALIEGLVHGVNGENVYRNRSFLADRLGKKIGAETVNVVDDGTLDSGMGSSPVDGEGVPTRRKYVVEQGVLSSFLYDTYTARKADVVSTGNAVRDSYAGRPTIGGLNVFMEAGPHTPEEIVADVSDGFYVFRLMGGGPNIVTGDFSAGAAGVWIEKGNLAHPVAKVTIAAGMSEMLEGIDAIGNDLVLDSSVACPTFRIREMTVSGI